MAGDVLEDDVVDEVGLAGVGAHGPDAGAAGLVAHDVGHVDVCAVALDRDAVLLDGASQLLSLRVCLSLAVFDAEQQQQRCSRGAAMQ